MERKPLKNSLIFVTICKKIVGTFDFFLVCLPFQSAQTFQNASMFFRFLFHYPNVFLGKQKILMPQIYPSVLRLSNIHHSCQLPLHVYWLSLVFSDFFNFFSQRRRSVEKKNETNRKNQTWIKKLVFCIKNFPKLHNFLKILSNQPEHYIKLKDFSTWKVLRTYP